VERLGRDMPARPRRAGISRNIVVSIITKIYDSKKIVLFSNKSLT